MLQAYLHGLILAFGLILPLGVQNVFVFNQGSTQPSFRRVLPVVITAALSDTLLILLAVLGVSVVVLQLAWVKVLLGVSGILFLTYMGWITWNSQPPANLQSASQQAAAGVAPLPDSHSLWPIRRQVFFALSVSLLNPHAILDTVGVIGTSSLSYSGESRIAFTLACVTTSWIWFTLLAAAGKLVRAVDSTGRLVSIFNRVSAVIMWASTLLLIKILFL
ncbi:MAG TPA: LysE/ArgO family amino acid transporter [Bacillota bacterium]|nr:LysE/ArgO family amino acid transporter [Bacillota bacterium]